MLTRLSGIKGLLGSQQTTKNRLLYRCKRDAISFHHGFQYSIASISDTGGIFTLALHSSVNMAPWVGHRGYGPPYHTTYKTNAHALTLHMSWDVRQARLHVSHAFIPSIRCPRPTYTLICIYTTQIVRNERETTKDRLS